MFVVIWEICSRLQQEKPQQAYTYMVDLAESRVCANDVYIFGYCYIYAISMLYIRRLIAGYTSVSRNFVSL
jgi:hypothetical protein